MIDPGPASWLRRWARRKAEAARLAPSPDAPAAPAAGTGRVRDTANSLEAPATGAATAVPPGQPLTTDPPGRASSGIAATPPQAAPDAPPEALPPVESLIYESDFTPYLRSEVPEALREQALRRLWRSNPLLANRDGLNDYDEDFSMVGKLPEIVNTVYEVGRGLMGAAPEAAGDAEDSAGSAPLAEGNQAAEQGLGPADQAADHAPEPASEGGPTEAGPGPRSPGESA